MLRWSDNDDLFFRELEEGRKWELYVASKLLRAGLWVQVPTKSVRNSIDDVPAYADEADIWVTRKDPAKIEVKSRRVAFTDPDDIPPNRDPSFLRYHREQLAERHHETRGDSDSLAGDRRGRRGFGQAQRGLGGSATVRSHQGHRRPLLPRPSRKPLHLRRIRRVHEGKGGEGRPRRGRPILVVAAVRRPKPSFRDASIGGS